LPRQSLNNRQPSFAGSMPELDQALTLSYGIDAIDGNIHQKNHPSRRNIMLIKSRLSIHNAVDNETTD